MRNLILVISLVAAACNFSSEGSEGRLLFTPDECGRIAGCDFDDYVGVGGRINVHISGNHGTSSVGVDLQSDDPEVFTVSAIADVGGRPTWSILGAGAGTANLTGYDSSDQVLDFLPVTVVDVSSLTLENFVGDAVQLSDNEGFDEAWAVTANEPISFYVTPLLADRSPTMGVYDYVATVDSSLNEGLLAGADLGAGYLYFRVDSGDYQVSFETTQGHRLDALIKAQ